MVGLAA